MLKFIVYNQRPIGYGTKFKKTYDQGTAFRVIKCTGEILELKKVGKGNHHTFEAHASLFACSPKWTAPYNSLLNTDCLRFMQMQLNKF